MRTIHAPFNIDTYNDFERNANIGGRIVLAVDDMDHCNSILAAYIKRNSMRTALIRHGIHNTGTLESGYGCYSISTSTAPALLSSKASIDDFGCYIFDSYKMFNNGRNRKIVEGINCPDYVPIIFIVDTKIEDVPTGNRINVVRIPEFEYDVKNWTPEEDEFLKSVYPIVGTGAAAYIDGTREIDCYRRFIYISNNKKIIIDQEENLITINDNAITPIGVESGNDNASSDNTPKTEEEDSVVKNDWTEEEDEIIRTKYISMGSDIVNELNGRTFMDCYNRACQLGVVSKLAGSWTKEEDELLLKYYPTEKNNITKYLPNRTKIACARRYKLITGR